MTDMVRPAVRARFAGIPASTWMIAIVAGLLAALDRAEPTGTAWVDVVLVVVGVTAVVALAAGPWWSHTAVAGLGAALALQPVGACVGLAGFVIGAVAGSHPNSGSRTLSMAPIVAAGLALNSSIRSDLDVFAGASALIGIASATILVALGWRRRPVALRRMIVRGALGAVALVIVAGGLAAAAALSARSSLASASTTSRDAVAALDAGDYDLAGSLFATSAGDFRRVDARLSSVWTWPSRLVPMLGQNVRAGSVLARAAARTTEVAAESLVLIDPSALSVSGGAIDVDAIRDVEGPLTRVHEVVAELEDALAEVDSPWLVAPFQDELDEIDEEFVAHGTRLDNVVSAVRLLPAMLGADDSRTYLVLFTTPAEARGLGGFAGSYTTVEVDDGVLNVRGVGRIEDLNVDTIGADCTACAAELLQRYGRFGLTTGPNGTTGDATWSNLTMSAHFPDVADAADRLFPQATGNEIDGVIVMDPYVVEQFVEYGGPIVVPSFDRTVEPNEVAQFILRDQYLRADDRGVRLDALAALGAGALASVLDGDLPEPAVILGDLAELVAERRLLMWTDRADEQRLLDDIGLLGSLPKLEPMAGGFSVSVTNASGSKIDVFLERQVVAAVTESDGQRILHADVTLTNTAPIDGLPDYVIGNKIGLPTGSSRLFVTFYGPRSPTDATLDGDPVTLESLPEAGWIASGHFVTLEPGQARRYRLEFTLDATDDAAGSAEPRIWEQPLSQRT